MTAAELDELEALANAATPGPWLWGRHTFKTKDEAKEWISETFEQREGLELWMSFVPDPERPGESLFTAITGNGPHSEANAAFVAQLGDAVPKLIARVRELEDLLDEPPCDHCNNCDEGCWGPRRESMQDRGSRALRGRIA